MIEDKFINRASEALLEVCNNEDDHIIGVRKMVAIDNVCGGYRTRYRIRGSLSDEEYETFNKTVTTIVNKKN